MRPGLPNLQLVAKGLIPFVQLLVAELGRVPKVSDGAGGGIRTRELAGYGGDP